MCLSFSGFASRGPHPFHLPGRFASQNNLLVREASDRLPFPSGNSLVALPTDVAFFFEGSDRDRVIVVDLGRARRVREAGVELMPCPGVDVVRSAMNR